VVIISLGERVVCERGWVMYELRVQGAADVDAAAEERDMEVLLTDARRVDHLPDHIWVAWFESPQTLASLLYSFSNHFDIVNITRGGAEDACTLPVYPQRGAKPSPWDHRVRAGAEVAHGCFQQFYE